MFETLASRADAHDRRVIRRDAEQAVLEAGAISPRIADLLLQDIEPKINPITGEVEGIKECVSKWRESHEAFFNLQPAPELHQAGTVAEVSTGALHATVAGGLPDLRPLSPKQRRAAVSQYVTGVRGGRGSRRG
jgi:hypothetical protein